MTTIYFNYNYGVLCTRIYILLSFMKMTKRSEILMVLKFTLQVYNNNNNIHFLLSSCQDTFFVYRTR